MQGKTKAEQIIEKLIADNPALHIISESVANDYDFLSFKPGLTSWAVRPEILRKLTQIVESSDITLETGGGHTTVAFAALGKQHICINPDVGGCELIKNYLEQLDISISPVQFIFESSDVALARLELGQEVDVAFIDGCHGFPFPAIDWHYIDRHLKIGGVLAIDDIDIPSVEVLCHFLERNGTYVLEDTILETGFYRKISNDKDREWPFQKFNERKLKGIQQPLSNQNTSSNWLRQIRSKLKL